MEIFHEPFGHNKIDGLVVRDCMVATKLGNKGCILREDEERGFTEKDVYAPEKELWRHSFSLSASTSLT